MGKKRWIILVASCLALSAGPLVGCSDDGDPSTNNTSNNQAGDDAGNDDMDPDTGDNMDPDGGDNMDPDTGDNMDPDTGDNMDPDTGDNMDPDGGDNMDPDGGDNMDPDGGDNPQGCTVNDQFSGQTYTDGNDPDPHNGGNPVDASTVTLADAGLQAVVDATPAAEGETATPADPIEVSGALVLATGFDSNATEYDDRNGSLFLQDANASLLTYQLFDADSNPDTPVKVGDKVSFKVTEIQNYDNKTEITAITDFSVDSSDNDVPFTDLTDGEVTPDDYGKVVRVSGELTASDGNCPAESDSVCYELSHGDNTVTFRTNSTFVEVGSCVTFFGPVTTFPGPLADDADTAEPQLDVVNYDWSTSSSN